MEMRIRRLWILWVVIVSWSSRTNWVAGQRRLDAFLLNQTCQGVVLQYQTGSVTKIYPFLAPNDPKQPYRFESILSLENQGLKEVKNWQAYVGFQRNEVLVSAGGVILADGQQLPAEVGNGTTFSGFPVTDLMNAIETAGDATKTTVMINLTGTEFGFAGPSSPLPNNISLLNVGWNCSQPKTQTNLMEVCCVENATAADIVPSLKYLPSEEGDITMSYNVLQTYDGNYWASVTIDNDNPLGRLDYWNLTWEWTQGEFIYNMQGAATVEQDQSDCLNGPAGQYYKDMDFSQVMNCQQNPVIHDLPVDKANDTKIGKIPFCCRNGTLLPPIMDPSRSMSAFKLQVYKIPPNLARDQLVPPVNWNIGTGYYCGQPRLVAPLEYLDPSGNLHQLSAVMSWQVTCNISSSSLANGLDTAQPLVNLTKTSPSCCVSFSAFYNTSAVPCKTCACGCTKTQQLTCNASSEAMLLPYNGLLIPSENRSSMAVTWAGLNHLPVPKQLPCPDNCGVNLNWYIVSDFTGGWSARLTIMNWESEAFADWFTALEFKKALPGFQAVYSFNGTQFSNNASKTNTTLFLQGLPGSNYLVGEVNNNAGKQQSILSFTKASTPNIDIVAGDGFPSRVIFNGEECSLPDMIPSGTEERLTRFWASFLMAFVGLVCLIILC